MNINKSIQSFTFKLLENIEIILIYIYAFFGLNSNVFNIIGQIPNYLLYYFPFIYSLMIPKIINFNNSEKSIFGYFIIMDIITKISLPFTKIVKFNLVLIILFQMFIILTNFCWDILLNSDLVESQLKLEYEFGFSEFKSESPFFYYDNIFYSFFWLFYFIIYLYCFIYAIQKKFPKFPGHTQKIVDSIIFLFAKQERIKNLKQINLY